MFFISKIQEIIFSLYSQKQVFENRKQKLLRSEERRVGKEC